MKRIIQAVLISTAVLALAPAIAASYGPVSSKNPGYLTDASGNIIKSARTGQCVRLARHWNPAVANKDCLTAIPASGRPR